MVFIAKKIHSYNLHAFGLKGNLLHIEIILKNHTISSIIIFVHFCVPKFYFEYWFNLICNIRLILFSFVFAWSTIIYLYILFFFLHQRLDKIVWAGSIFCYVDHFFFNLYFSVCFYIYIFFFIFRIHLKHWICTAAFVAKCIKCSKIVK